MDDQTLTIGQLARQARLRTSAKRAGFSLDEPRVLLAASDCRCATLDACALFEP